MSSGKAVVLSVGMSGYLFCEECSDEANTFERGWRSFLTDDEDEPGGVGVLILCPACADLEFGPLIRRTREEEV